MLFAIKIIASSLIIALSSWLAGSQPSLAGFIVALPIASLISIAFTQAEWQDPEKSVVFAKNILLSMPLTLTFFLPFLFAKKIRFPFWGIYASGVALLMLAYFVKLKFFND